VLGHDANALRLVPEVGRDVRGPELLGSGGELLGPPGDERELVAVLRASASPIPDDPPVTSAAFMESEYPRSSHAPPLMAGGGLCPPGGPPNAVHAQR
jgi:hypothetical protein